jgi:hypothetical protein
VLSLLYGRKALFLKGGIIIYVFYEKEKEGT